MRDAGLWGGMMIYGWMAIAFAVGPDQSNGVN